ncbi:AMP-binding protein [Sphingomonas sp. G-3-2-10]|uniref:AMP-binding protein n=1 Tax=Sphingomonas sp. G-3-2-10 TaxID=2728838 RepID=UPI0019CF7902|nr:AMP-binding protein [Sphingomonas sp. G-3-2-10]
MDSIANKGRRSIAGRLIRWDEDRAARAYAGGWWTCDTLGDALRRAAAETPSRIVLIDGERQIDCATLFDEASAMARALLARAEPGSTVSFMLPNWHESATIYLGATLAGMIVHPILPSLRERELLHMLPDIDSRVVFIPERLRNQDYAAMLGTVCGQLERPPEIVVLRGDARGHTAYADLLAERHDIELPQVDADAVQMILYTSGTTGSPKGVMHSHNSLGALVRQLGQHWLIEPGDRFIVPSPVSHIGGSIYAFELPLLLGASAVLMEQWDADACVELIERHGCTHMAGATPFLEGLIAAARTRGTRLPSLKLFICGGAAIPPAVIREGVAQFENAVVSRVYGSTEVPVTTVGSIGRDDLTHAAETDGRPGIAEVRLGSHVAASADEGEIYARGPQMLVGYVHAEDEASVFDDGGFYRTGDIGRWIDGEYLVVSGRAKDIIIRKGENISPKEVEDILLEHPEVAEVAIVGLPDPVTGERACAVVVATSGAAPDLATLGAYLAGKGLAAFKRPERVELWDALPRNATGKVLKHEIRATLLAAMQAA